MHFSTLATAAIGIVGVANAIPGKPAYYEGDDAVVGPDLNAGGGQPNYPNGQTKVDLPIKEADDMLERLSGGRYGIRMKDEHPQPQDVGRQYGSRRYPRSWTESRRGDDDDRSYGGGKGDDDDDADAYEDGDD